MQLLLGCCLTTTICWRDCLWLASPMHVTTIQGIPNPKLMIQLIDAKKTLPLFYRTVEVCWMSRWQKAGHPGSMTQKWWGIRGPSCCTWVDHNNPRPNCKDHNNAQSIGVCFLTLYLQSSEPDSKRLLTGFQSTLSTMPSWAFHCNTIIHHYF